MTSALLSIDDRGPPAPCPEAAIATLAQISDCAVTEVKVASGTTVIACFYCAPHPIDEALLFDHAKGCPARWKQPRLYRHLASLPRNVNHKLNRRALRASFGPDVP